MGGPQDPDHGGVDELAAGPERESPAVPSWLWRGAAVVAAAAVAVTTGPHLLSSGGGDPGRRPVPTQASWTPDPRPVPFRPAATLSWAPRGSGLRTAFATDALRRLRVERADVDRLLWVGSLDGHDRLALATYRPAVAGFTGPGVGVVGLRVGAGGDVSAASPVPVGEVQDNGMVGFAWQGDDGHTRLLLLSRPDELAVQVSAQVRYTPDGRIGRTWLGRRLTDGVLVADLGPDADPIVVVRPNPRGALTGPILVPAHGRRRPTPYADWRVSGDTGPRYHGPDVGILVAGLAQAVRPMFDLRAATSSVVWSGALPGGRAADGRPVSGRAALVRVRRDDGAVFQAFVFASEDGSYSSAVAYPAPWSLVDRLPYAFSTYLPDAPLLLVNPGGAGSVTLTRANHDSQTVRTGPDGVATLLPEGIVGGSYSGAAVVVRDPTGRVVLRSSLVDPASVDAFGLYL